jgi:hypothetical protein
MKEHVLGFLRTYPMPFPIFVGIGIVPIKPGTTLQRVHGGHETSI